MNEFGELIIALDCLLTGKKLEECRKNFEIKSAPWTDPAYWLWERTDIYYLSDGGYSRNV